MQSHRSYYSLQNTRMASTSVAIVKDNEHTVQSIWLRMRVNRQEVSQIEHNQNTIMSLYRATVKHLSRPDLAPCSGILQRPSRCYCAEFATSQWRTTCAQQWMLGLPVELSLMERRRFLHLFKSPLSGWPLGALLCLRHSWHDEREKQRTADVSFWEKPDAACLYGSRCQAIQTMVFMSMLLVCSRVWKSNTKSKCNGW